MDDTLLKYDQSLEALEKQRESLELVMQKMGEEWEESGAGIGWLGDSLYNTTTTNKSLPPPPLMSLMHSVTSSSSEPSHDYLQTLLNVNDELLAQSLASTTTAITNSTPVADGDFSNYNTQNHYPHLLKSSAFTSHHTQDLPASPAISQEENDINPIQLLSQFTPPITPE